MFLVQIRCIFILVQKCTEFAPKTLSAFENFACSMENKKACKILDLQAF